MSFYTFSLFFRRLPFRLLRDPTTFAPTALREPSPSGFNQTNQAMNFVWMTSCSTPRIRQFIRRTGEFYIFDNFQKKQLFFAVRSGLSSRWRWRSTESTSKFTKKILHLLVDSLGSELNIEWMTKSNILDGNFPTKFF